MFRKIIITPYQPIWVEKFEEEAVKLTTVFSSNLIAIHHFGSTSIPDLAAKAVIDILLIVNNIEEVNICNKAMISLSYIVRGENGIAGRRLFCKDENGHRTIHVHVYQVGNQEIDRHLNFRDYLQAHPAVSSAYGELKMELAHKFQTDPFSYTAGKTAFIQTIERIARHWKNQTSNENSATFC